MTGKELIIYILECDLVNKEVFKNGVFIGFINEYEAASRFNVGIETIRAWFLIGKLKGVSIGDHIYFLNNIEDPRECKI